MSNSLKFVNFLMIYLLLCVIFSRTQKLFYPSSIIFFKKIICYNISGLNTHDLYVYHRRENVGLLTFKEAADYEVSTGST